MHELSIAEQVLEVVVRTAKAHGATAVESIELEIGAMRLVVPEALELAFQAISEGTIAFGAKLIQREVPISLACRRCGRKFEGVIDDFACPACGVAETEVIGGNDIVLRSIVCSTPEKPEDDDGDGAVH